MSKICSILERSLLILSVFLLAACSSEHLSSVAKVTNPPESRAIQTPVNVALVLGGGGARGYATVGVIKVLQNQGVPVNLIAGASVGSIVGSLYAHDGDANEAYNQMMSAGFFDFADISLFDSTGIMTGKHMLRFMKTHLQNDHFKQLKIPLLVTTTDIKSGNQFVIKSGPVAPAVVASAAVPGVIEPQVLYHRYLCDGGVIDNLPVDLVKKYQPEIIIAVNINKVFEHVVPKSSFGMLARAYVIMSRQMALHHQQGATVIIHPNVGQASMFSMKNKALLVQEGEQAACRKMKKIKKQMAEKDIDPVYPFGKPSVNICQELSLRAHLKMSAKRMAA
jgi:NTE family protein